MSENTGALSPVEALGLAAAPAEVGGLEDLDAAALAYAERIVAASPAERATLRDALSRLCLPFCRRLARRYRGRGESLDDIEQVARLGLVKAIDRYDPGRGSFTAYAVITISGEIKRHFRDKTWGVHVPRRVQDLSLEVGHATTVLTAQLSRTPTAAEIADRLGLTVEAVRDAQESSAGYSPSSLNAPVGDGAAEFGDLLGDVDGDLELVDDRVTVADLLMRLPARERRMLALRFYGNRTQTEIADELGISQMHVSRLLTRALSWLREAMLSDVPPRWEGVEARPERHPVQVEAEHHDGVVTARVRGEVDRDTAERLRLGLRHAIALSGGDPVEIDLSGVPLLDAAGVAVLVDAASAAAVAEVDLTLTGAQAYVAGILKVTGLARLLKTDRPRNKAERDETKRDKALATKRSARSKT
ncbi:SigB/SigF/SigG family RNA polymerase sigma factor [Actinoplanes sp. LDG1-06]|uniref:Anti-sigma factor antagonist n=1 Tax=Paractinoplanes ovalisporus TaxID=2810368 RepID=A0ABS2AJL0_9ACTN|nr:SigB/SigF/SigG family RNA polymerase sigma factor [Actinoplanes ovalisporus]MBM2619968.1 SigB/SigF/SigG family RNA polymerase sigma factor [Actinoplanes ovalisporus]